MPFDVIGFYESGAQTFAVSVTPVPDSQYSISGTDYYLVQKYAPYVLGVFHSAVSTPARCRIFQPQLTPPYDFSKSVLTGTAGPAQGLTYLAGRPLPLTIGEQLAFKAVNATSEVTLGGLFLGSGKMTQAMLDAVNPTHTLKGSSSTAHVAGTWTDCVMVWDEQLPEGRYAIVGMKAAFYKASGPMNGLARIVLVDSAWRVGCVASIMTGDRTLVVAQDGDEDKGTFSTWAKMDGISFDNINPPQHVQCLSGAANTKTDIELILEKIG